MELPETNIISTCCNLIQKFVKLFQGVDQILPINNHLPTHVEKLLLIDISSTIPRKG